MTKEQDKQIAEMMGWHYKEKLQWNGTRMYYVDDNEKCVYGAPFHPTTDANDDHIVLNHIRENWDQEKVFVFLDILHISLYRKHIDLFSELDVAQKTYFNHLNILHYEPGDYSKAALKVINDNS